MLWTKCFNKHYKWLKYVTKIERNIHKKYHGIYNVKINKNNTFHHFMVFQQVINKT